MTYSTMTYRPSYRLEFDKQYKKRSGYVRLRFCEPVKITKSDAVDDVLLSSDRNDSTETSNSTTTSQTMSSLISMSDDVRVINDRGIYHPPSQGSTSTSDYDYTYMAQFNEHRPLMASINSGYVNRSQNSAKITDPRMASTIPDECITEIRRMITVSTAVGNESEYESPGRTAEEDDDENLEYKFQYMEQRGQYLNSKMFMSHFRRIFHDHISENLEIGAEQLMNATWKGASIYCPVERNAVSRNYYEIIPAIACPWPSEAIDWFNRKRVLAAAPNAAKPWMTEEMINRIFELSCHAIPIGYVSKKTQKSSHQFNHSLEWKITFPDAERYLESRLTDAQLKVYILAKILYKTFIEPMNIPMTSSSRSTNTTMSLPDLTTAIKLESAAAPTRQFNFITDEHLRAHLFTQCELNTIKWSEFNLGGNLMEFLRTFLHRVQTKNLPDFFLPKRNLFEHVPENVITRLHESIFRIVENPSMFVMKALQNVRFVRKFYPKINIKRLYTILTIAEPMTLVNPSLYAESSRLESGEEEDHEEVAERDADLKYALGSMAEYHQQVDTDPDKKRLTRQMRYEEMNKIKQRTAAAAISRQKGATTSSEGIINTEVSYQ